MLWRLILYIQKEMSNDEGVSWTYDTPSSLLCIIFLKKNIFYFQILGSFNKKA